MVLETSSMSDGLESGKKLKDPKDPSKIIWGIRMRMTQRGFKDEQADNLKTYSGTSSRTSQRIVVSECACRRWKMATLDLKKAFLKGVAYQELADLAGEPLREVNFEVTEEVAKNTEKH